MLRKIFPNLRPLKLEGRRARKLGKLLFFRTRPRPWLSPLPSIGRADLPLLPMVTLQTVTAILRSAATCDQARMSPAIWRAGRRKNLNHRQAITRLSV